MLLDALHAVAVLPPGGAEVLLQGTGHGGKYCQSCFTHIHNVRRCCALILFLHPPDMCEGLLHSHHQPDEEGTHTQQSVYCQLSTLVFNPYRLLSNLMYQCNWPHGVCYVNVPYSFIMTGLLWKEPQSLKSVFCFQSLHQWILSLTTYICSHDSPGSTFTDSPLVVGLFVVQLIVGAIFAFGSSCNHGPWLIPITRLRSCRVPWGCTKRRGQRQIGYISMSRG